MHEMILFGWDRYVQEKLHFPSIRGYLITRYLLEGRGSTYIGKELGGITRYRVVNLLRECKIDPRGSKIAFLTDKERAYWEKEYQKEEKKAKVGSFFEVEERSTA